MRTPGWAEMWRTFGQIGIMSFGGPAAQIALMHRVLVDEKKWLDEADYLRALSFCMLLPGPEAMQLATYSGWRLKGTAGGLLAGLLFVLPGATVVMTLAALYAVWGQQPLIAALFLGVKACVVVIVIEALLRVAKRALKGRVERIFALCSFTALFFLGLPFPLVIVAAALSGAFILRGAVDTKTAPLPAHGHLLPTLAVGGALWVAPLIVLAWVGQDLLLAIGLFFSKLAMVTFGGAYAVLAYMTQEVVQEHGWLTTAEMIDALGLAETTPGPLILVTEFVGFLTAWKVGGWTYGAIAGLLVLWVTFVPCFLWIFAFAPYIEWIASRPGLQAALRGITAAVVGVIGNLGLWFGLHVLFGRLGSLSVGPVRLTIPDPATLDLAALSIMGLPGVLLLWRHWPLPAVLGLSAAAGWLLAQPL